MYKSLPYKLLILATLFMVAFSFNAQAQLQKNQKEKPLKKDNQKRISSAVTANDVLDPPTIDKSNVRINNPNCGESNGSISGLTFTGVGLTYLWTQPGVPSFQQTTPYLSSVPEGIYQLQIITVAGLSAEATFTLSSTKDLSLDASNVAITETSCGQSTGSITNLKVTSIYAVTYSWRNQYDVEIAKTLNITNQPAGTYTLTIIGGPNGKCIEKYAGFIRNTNGLSVDFSNILIRPNNCKRIGGGIFGVRAFGVGKIKYEWFWLGAEPNELSGYNADLRTSRSGGFRLKVSDESGCEPIISKTFIIGRQLEYLFDFSKIKVTPASCENYASVTGIEEQQNITGVLYYSWINDKGDTVSHDATYHTNAGGKYFLSVQNPCSLEVASPIFYPVDFGPPVTFMGEYRYTLKNSCLSQNTGSISIDAYPPFIKRLRWVDKYGGTVGEGPALNNLPPGDYSLYSTDNFNCERFYKTYSIIEVSPVQLSGGIALGDTCNTHSGSITDAEVVNGYPPFTYVWKDASGNVVGTNLELYERGVGEYTLSISDGTGCEGPTKTFRIENLDIVPAAPTVNSIYICTGGEAVFRVTNQLPRRSYRLYDSPNSITPIDETLNGEFRVKVYTNRKFYISCVHGDCEGPRTEMSVSIGLFIEDVTNTFTPNNDGINDFWLIRNVDKYTDALVQVYDRSGFQVFQSRGYAKPFDGIFRGKTLPSGTYYYVITLDRGCKVSGNVTILR